MKRKVRRNGGWAQMIKRRGGGGGQGFGIHGGGGQPYQDPGNGRDFGGGQDLGTEQPVPQPPQAENYQPPVDGGAHPIAPAPTDGQPGQPGSKVALANASGSIDGMLHNQDEATLWSLLHAQRPHLQPDFALCKAAHIRAEKMVGDIGDHKDRNGEGPNQEIIEAGFPLPSNEAHQFNTTESIHWNVASAAQAWDGWMKSPGHAQHILGKVQSGWRWLQHQFYGDNNRDYACVGVAKRGNQSAWVILTAKKANQPKATNPYPYQFALR